MPDPGVQGYPTSTKTLIRAFMAQLATVTNLDPNLIKFARMGSKIPFSGDRDIILRLTRPKPYDGLMTGAAEYGMQAAVTRGLHVQLRTRLGVGLSDRDDQWLDGVTLSDPPTPDELSMFGQSDFEDMILVALVPFRPYATTEDDVVNVLTVDDVLLVDGTEYQDEFRQIPPDDPTWGSSQLVFRVNYVIQSAPLPDPES
jgi:hypothetical protein